MLKPGTYLLTRDVENPTPDRRKTSDWRALPVWKAGWEFIVEEQFTRTDDDDMLEGLDLPPETRAKLKERNLWTCILLVGHRWKHENITGNNTEQYAALEAALVPCDESHEAMFTRCGVNDYFARWLVESGRLTSRAFEILWDAYQDNEQTLVSDPVSRGSQLTSAEIDPPCSACGGARVTRSSVCHCPPSDVVVPGYSNAAAYDAIAERAISDAKCAGLLPDTLIGALRADNARLRAVLEACPFGVMESTETPQLMTPRHMSEDQLCEWVRRVYVARKPSNAVALATISAEGGIK